MLAKIINNETKEVAVANEAQREHFESIGFSDMEVEKGYNGKWYVKGYAPQPTKEEQSAKREIAYVDEVDPITCHINRLKDEEQTPEIEQEIEELKQERSTKVEEIKRRYPYNEE